MSIEIPLLGSDSEVIEISFDELPDDVEEVIHILKTGLPCPTNYTLAATQSSLNIPYQRLIQKLEMHFNAE